MTTLRFVGDIPLWLGLGLALIAGLLSWRYYRRESFDLPRGLRWFLPLLRSLAFFLGIMVLTGPVLHHRTIIGELGRVKIYLDGSRSMTMNDRHMATGRKLLIAEQLGWLSGSHVDMSLLDAADDFAEARSEFLELSAIKSPNAATPPVDGPTNAGSGAANAGAAIGMTPGTILGFDLDVVRKAVAAWQARMKAVQTKLPQSLSEQLNEKVLQPLEAAMSPAEATLETIQPQILSFVTASETIEESIRGAFEDNVNELVRSGDPSLQTALALFDETPRIRRAELGLSESTAQLLRKLREQHDVEVLTLSGESASPRKTLEPAASERSAASVRSVDQTGSADGTSSVAVDSAPETFASITDLSSGIVATQKATAVAADSPTEDAAAAPSTKTAIVLLTDGQHNSGPSPLQTARVLGAQGVSFFGVSIGASQEAADLAVTSLEHPDLVFQKDTVRGIMIIADRMPAGRPFVAQVRHGDDVLWQQQLVSQNVGERRIEFAFRIEDLVTQLGAQFVSDLRQHTIPLAFEASLAPLAEESETNNNQRTMRLAAIVQSYKVLILDGRSRWETRYLRNAFERDSQWSVNTIIAGPGTDEPVLRRGDEEGAFPATREAMFKFDLIILGELSPAMLTDSDRDWLRDFVEIRGGGLILIDGQRGALLSFTGGSAESLLPVEWLTEKVTSKPAALRLTEKGASESALMLAVDDPQNRRFWTELPAPHSLVAVGALPGSEVLVEATVGDRQYPAMVTRQVGAGRVLYLAFDETWRWRYKAADKWHQRIWNQMARYIMPRPFSVSDDFVSIDTGSVRYDFGSSVDVRVRLLSLDGKPTMDASADALVWKNGQVVSTVSLISDKDVPGIYRGRVGALPEGEYEVSVRAAGYSEAALKARSQFVVLPPESGEMTQTGANESLLKQMAAASGGAWLREEEMGQLSELLAPLSSGRVVESDTLIWQSYWWFVAIVLLLTVEWLLRKRAGLL